jgi:hypothetical protein
VAPLVLTFSHNHKGMMIFAWCGENFFKENVLRQVFNPGSSIHHEQEFWQKHPREFLKKTHAYAG